ncbi:MAG: cysteine lyase, partial [Chloroflexota bacterium]
AISHLQWSSGAVMPLAEIAALARERGILIIVDGAQSVGQIRVALHELGVDAYAMSGQKWLCGPNGTGALYLRRDRFADITPVYL